MDVNLVSQWRKESKHTFEEMSARCGASPSHLCSISAGRVGASDELTKKIEVVRNKEFLIRNDVPDKAVIQYEIDLLKRHNSELVAEKIALASETWWDLKITISKIPGSIYDPKLKQVRDLLEGVDLDVEFSEDPKECGVKEKCPDCNGSGSDETGQDFCRSCRGKVAPAKRPGEDMAELRREIKRLKSALTKSHQDFDSMRLMNVENQGLRKQIIQKEKDIQIVAQERNLRVQELSRIDPAKLNRHSENEMMIIEALPIIDSVWTSSAATLAQRFKKKYKGRFTENGV